MTEIDGLRLFNPDKPITLPGSKCAYCGCALARQNRTRDHSIGRRFVPEGTLLNSFNLLLQACRPCNDRKAALEDDISLITMLPDTGGRYARDDERLRRTVQRKARGSISAATRRLAVESYNSVKFRYPFGAGVTLTYEGVAMPTLDEQRVARLAYYHVQAFAFLRSFDVVRQHGAWLQIPDFLVLGWLTRDDWGNPRLRHFMDQISAWEVVGLVAAADGYFRHVMRKCPQAELWAWAVEWNERLRVFGIYGATPAREAFSAAMPRVRPDLSWGDTTNDFAMHWETPLPESEDRLFECPTSALNQEFAAPHWRREVA